mgnify:CR=1 FL=1
MIIRSSKNLRIKEAYVIDAYAEDPHDEDLWCSTFFPVRNARDTFSAIEKGTRAQNPIPGSWKPYWRGPNEITILNSSDFKYDKIPDNMVIDNRAFLIILQIEKRDEIVLAGKTSVISIVAEYGESPALATMGFSYPMEYIRVACELLKHKMKSDFSYPISIPLMTYGTDDWGFHEFKINKKGFTESKLGCFESLMLHTRNIGESVS